MGMLHVFRFVAEESEHFERIYVFLSTLPDDVFLFFWLTRDLCGRAAS